ncbi:MAG: undecaprenyldiphospho-muramoylpentapeptide beta-N-acetylglucosaminyltransferase [Bacteroidales bacterium]|nr:undecaprenyldiphospho-muramoylpentapeptide beta-N-acetylglucosaminyltransferase [Bacteroidales bacterium]
MKAIISGGGTGGHIFPALAIANAIKSRYSDADILFVGAEGRMEMEKVPAAGYTIKGLPISGLQRQLTLSNIIKNLQLPFKMIRSRRMVKRILRTFQPDIVVGVGGFASEPTLKAAASMGFPTLIQEQNSYAGLTNKMLAKKADRICVAYEGMERFFPADKIVFTGNPIRADIEHMTVSRDEGINHFELDNNAKNLLVIGGSLGARSINNMILNNLSAIKTYHEQYGMQVIWQTGKWMYNDAVQAVKQAGMESIVKVHQFISRMDLAYASADVIISRAGAIAISELCIVGKPTILIPSPNVAEDHQTKNALALADKGAAIMIRDNECGETGINTVVELINNDEKKRAMCQNIRSLAKYDAAEHIVDEIDKIVHKN